MPTLNLALLQIDLAWEQPELNRAEIERQLAALRPGIDLVVLPEMFLTGFSMQPSQLSPESEAETVHWLLELAQSHNVAICGSIAVNQQGEYRNRFLFVTPQGRLTRYDKRHLFTPAGEDRHYAPGETRVLIHYRGFRILPIICYDLRFPVWCRNRNEYDLMICVANWPSPRRNAWRTLLQARAIENQCYVVGVNRVGVDGQGLPYSGDSLAVDYKGELMFDAPPEKSVVGQVELELDGLHRFKERFAVYQDADAFSLSGIKTTLFEL